MIEALSYFDSIISGVNLEDGYIEITDKHISLLNGLIKCEMNNNDNDNLYDPYVVSIFKSFIKTKENITIDYEYLDCQDANKNIVDLIMYPFVVNEDWTIQRDVDDNRNLFKSQLLYLFSNIKSITIMTNYDDEDEHRSLSMYLLLLMIKTVTSLERVSILSYGWDESFISWQNDLWITRKLSSQLNGKFEASDYKIQMKYAIGPEKSYHGFVITQK